MSFMIGVATSAHQVEGGNTNSDSWAQENMRYSSYVDKSGAACDHYARYADDIKLMRSAGLNAYRFTVEWARVEKNEGVFEEKEIEHYRNIALCCMANGIQPIVTLHHFSSPLWLIKCGGWDSEKTIEYFARFAGFVAQKLGDIVEYFCTINEANICLQIKALSEKFKDGNIQLGMDFERIKATAELVKSENKAVFGTDSPAVFLDGGSSRRDDIIIAAHKAARDAIKKANPDIKVGITLSLHDIQPSAGFVKEAELEWEKEFSHYLPHIKDDDFIGVQNYTRTVIGDSENRYPVTQAGYENYPEALANVVRRVYGESGLPVMITENGIATDDDCERIEFIRKAVNGVEVCVADGIPVLGYLYWSLFDNYEWQKGYNVKFGLVGVDMKTQKRSPKPSLYYLGNYAERGEL